MRSYTETRARAAVVTVLAALAVLGVYWFYVRTVDGRTLDTRAFESAGLRRSRIIDTASSILDLISLLSIVVAVIIIIGIAIVRRRLQVAIAGAIVVAGANATTQVLKAYVFTRPALGVQDAYPQSLPSGHTTAAASIAIALLIAVPVAWRAWVAPVGALMTFAIGFSTVVSGWHRPSDVVAAVLVALAWAALVVTVGGARIVAPTETPAPGRIVGERAVSVSRAVGGTWANGRTSSIVFLVMMVAGVAGIVAGVGTQVLAVGQDSWPERDLLAYAGSILGFTGIVLFSFALVMTLVRGSRARS